MSSVEYYEGRDMEKNLYLHKFLTQFFCFYKVNSDGSTGTKTDIVGYVGEDKTFFSVKNVTGKNTQVHLTTLGKLCVDLNTPPTIQKCMNYWLGTNDTITYNSWCEGVDVSEYEYDHNRLASWNVKGWKKVEDWFNLVNKDGSLPKLLIQSLNNGDKSKYLIWVNKNSKVVKLVDIERLIHFIRNQCKWITMPSGTIMRCVTPNNKAILWLQMKGNRTDEGYNHNPQFHIVENWPEEFVLQEFEL